MPIGFNDNVQTNAPRDLDNRRTKLVNGISIPFSSIAEANASTPIQYRYIGMEKLIDDGSGPKTYMYQGGILDNNLLPNTSSTHVFSNSFFQSLS